MHTKTLPQCQQVGLVVSQLEQRAALGNSGSLFAHQAADLLVNKLPGVIVRTP